MRATIDDVTHRAATLSRASDRLVQDRVDELTQIFVEQVASLADVSDDSKNAADKPINRGVHKDSVNQSDLPRSP